MTMKDLERMRTNVRKLAAEREAHVLPPTLNKQCNPFSVQPAGFGSIVGTYPTLAQLASKTQPRRFMESELRGGKTSTRDTVTNTLTEIGRNPEALPPTYFGEAVTWTFPPRLLKDRASQLRVTLDFYDMLVQHIRMLATSFSPSEADHRTLAAIHSAIIFAPMIGKLELPSWFVDAMAVVGIEVWALCADMANTLHQMLAGQAVAPRQTYLWADMSAILCAHALSESGGVVVQFYTEPGGDCARASSHDMHYDMFAPPSRLMQAIDACGSNDFPDFFAHMVTRTGFSRWPAELKHAINMQIRNALLNLEDV